MLIYALGMLEIRIEQPIRLLNEFLPHFIQRESELLYLNDTTGPAID